MGVSFDKILVVGIGLIGGSILKTIKELNLSFEVYGVDQNEEVTTHAHNLGLIKNRSNDLEKINEDCLIIFSVPSLSFEEVFKLVNNCVNKEKVIFTDTFSSKSNLLDFLERNPEVKQRFVMSHPIVGSEKSSISNSVPFLFRDKLVILSPVEATLKKENLTKLKNFWEVIGSKVSLLAPEEHDKLFSKTSHLPHVIAYALMNFLEKELGKKVFYYSGGSLESYTRIASSDPLMWKDIMVSNKGEILDAIKGFKSSLKEISELMESGDEKSILEFLRIVKETRDRLVEKDD